jgi:hypothetical protein
VRIRNNFTISNCVQNSIPVLSGLDRTYICGLILIISGASVTGNALRFITSPCNMIMELTHQKMSLFQSKVLCEAE